MTEQRAHFRQVDPHFPDAAFADVINANHEYVKDFQDSHLTGRAAKELAVVTCMDSRINPLAVLGMEEGDVKILRNAGARVTDIRSIEVRVVPDQRDALERDVTRVRAYPFLPDDLIVGGAIYDVKTGILNPQDF